MELIKELKGKNENNINLKNNKQNLKKWKGIVH